MLIGLFIGQAVHAPIVPRAQAETVETPLSYLEKLAGPKIKELNLAKEIIRREGGWSTDICNIEFGCGSGQGKFQVTPGTERVCEAYFGRPMNMINWKDNLDCGWWLLTANGARSGIRHWDDMSWVKGEKKKWGSGPYYLSNYGL